MLLERIPRMLIKHSHVYSMLTLLINETSVYQKWSYEAIDSTLCLLDALKI